MKKVSFFDAVVAKEAAAGTLNLLRDSEGRAVMADLPDGTRLRWRQMVYNGDFALGTIGWSKNASAKSFEVSGGILKVVSNDQKYSAGVVSKDLTYRPIIGNIYFISTEWRNFGFIQLRAILTSGGAYAEGITGQSVGGSFVKTDKYFIAQEADRFIQYGNTWSLANEDVYMEGKYIYLLDLTEMFGAGNEPSSAAAFQAMIHSEGTTELGYTPYTDTPIECIVCGGYIFKLTQT